MVTLITPSGAISESLVTSISATEDGKFYVYDRASNKLETTEFEFLKLKGLGKELRHDYIARIKAGQLSQY